MPRTLSDQLTDPADRDLAELLIAVLEDAGRITNLDLSEPCRVLALMTDARLAENLVRIERTLGGLAGIHRWSTVILLRTRIAERLER